MDIYKSIGIELQYFYSKHPYDESLKIDLMIVDDLYESCMQKASCAVEKNIISKSRERMSEFNGTICLGKSISDVYTVLISKKVFSHDTHTWRGTIQHEYSHVLDFYNFALINKIQSAEDIYRNEYYDTLAMWSEFHARRAGYERILNYLLPDPSDEERIELVQNNMPIIQSEFLVNQTVYELMQFMGRYSVLECYSDRIKTSYESLLLSESFNGNFEASIQLYNFLTNPKINKPKAEVLRTTKILFDKISLATLQ